jgi:hypothetical protein
MKPPSRDILHIMDTSLNRISEWRLGLEEYARFSLDGATTVIEAAPMMSKKRPGRCRK